MKTNLIVAVAVATSLFAGGSVAEDLKVGFINTQRLLREAPMAVTAQKKLEAEFSSRDQELQKQIKQIKALQENLEKNALTMSESERRAKEREVNEQSRDIQRKQREFREDLNLRNNELMTSIFERADKVIKQIAEAEKYDLILQEAAFVSARLDITEKVIKALADSGLK